MLLLKKNKKKNIWSAASLLSNQSNIAHVYIIELYCKYLQSIFDGIPSKMAEDKWGNCALILAFQAALRTQPHIEKC